MSTEQENVPIAIIGSACRFAGGVTCPSQLWNLLKEPRDVLGSIPENRFHAEGFYHPDASYHGHTNVLSSYTLDGDPGSFDTTFFKIKPVEAKAIDPQQRVLLEVVYEGLENAGLSIHNVRGSDTAVYVGIMSSDYENMLVQDVDVLPTYHSTGTSRAIAANRISYFFDLKGPSLTLDTACSSSLYAIHLAVQAIRNGDAEMAIACGSNLILGPNFYIFQNKLNMLSPDSRCRMWDEGANGYARGEGVAAVVLKSLPAALRDGDHIEAIIRETGLNQDGATNGITMPSTSAQTDLIRNTYLKAGLDPLTDGPQYFEAHGTGTQAGDPIEAEAIQRSLIRNCDIPYPRQRNSSDPLYIGSVKTVLGHTESVAGIAGLLKASLAIQHGLIPPNLLFDRLNPKVAPFYKDVCVPIRALRWPAIPDGQPRRASINSFGFGGANAHIILESSPNQDLMKDDGENETYGPYVFSAHSEQGLVKMLKNYITFLGSELSESVSARDLAWTLRSRRSLLPFKASFPTGNLEKLKRDIETRLQENAEKATPLGTLSLVSRRRVLGIFTGQGAQYIRMGSQLFERSSLARDTLQRLEVSLARLPVEDRPTWSLTKELNADEGSRVYEGAISQPLCTAVQIVLVNLLRQSGVEFDGVIGHSSGEIAAAYAGGYICAEDAIRIAYYRGIHIKAACSPNSNKMRGMMLAVGTSRDDAEELLQEPVFHGRVAIAASNSSSSVTLSGDEDAIAELETIFEDEKKFNRRLRTDIAYHSAHMMPCAQPYIRSLEKCNGDPMLDTVACSYWSDNLTQPVLFYEAMQRALNTGNFDLVVEVGPHPALRGPALETITQTLEKPLPYIGTLKRGSDPIEAFSDTLAFLWSHQETECTIDLDKYEETMQESTAKYRLVKNLPTYPWDHNRRHWHETRQTRRTRHREDHVHELLGHICPTVTSNQVSWRHFLRMREINWLVDHKIQDKPVFPAAGYISSMLEASCRIPQLSNAANRSKTVSLIEAFDFTVHRAMVLDEVSDDGDQGGIEIVIAMMDIGVEQQQNSEVIKARFSYMAAVDKDSNEMALMASADISITFSATSSAVLPTKSYSQPNMVNVACDSFFSRLLKTGYGYSGLFKAADNLKRSLGKAQCSIDPISLKTACASRLIVHPAILDSAFQTLLLALSHPGDNQLWTVFIPVRFDCIRVVPSFCQSVLPAKCITTKSASPMTVNTTIVGPSGLGFLGDLDVLIAADTAIQVQGVTLSPFATGSAESDTNMFARMRWSYFDPVAGGIALTDDISSKHRDICRVVERMAVYYMRMFISEVPNGHAARLDPTFSHYLKYCQDVVDLVDSGKHRYVSIECANDCWNDIESICAQYSELIDIRILRKIGEIMPSVFKGETTVLEHVFPSGLFADYYANAIGQQECVEWIGQAAAHIMHRYPRMNILEVGAGTGGATKSVLRKALHESFNSYTFTDVSTGFFEQTRGELNSLGLDSRIIFDVLDISKDPISQGFKYGSYDLIIASYVIHATPKLEETLRGLRNLLRPGGFIVIGENTNLELSGMNFIFGTLPGMWAGVEEGRTSSPYIPVQRWDNLLKKANFSGIEAVTPEFLADTFATSVFVSRAVDDHIELLRGSNAPLPIRPSLPNVVIIGDGSKNTTILANEVCEALRNSYGTTSKIFTRLTDVPSHILSSDTTFLSLAELDKPLFENIETDQFESFKILVGSQKRLLWVTRGRRATNPFCNISIGFLRTASCEVPDLCVQSVDFECGDNISATMIIDFLVPFKLASDLEGSLEKSNILWTNEPEIVVDSKGVRLIPRWESILDADKRYNSARRPISELTEPKKTPTAVCMDANGHFIFKQTPTLLPLSSETMLDSTTLETVYSLLWPIDTPFGSRFMSVAVISGKRCLALTETLVSVQRSANMIASAEFPEQATEGELKDILILAAAHVWSSFLLHAAFPGQNVVVHNPAPLLATVLQAHARERRINIILTSSDSDVASSKSWLHLPSYMTRREIQRALQVARISDFILFSDLDDDNNNSFMSSLPSDCRVKEVRLNLSKDIDQSPAPEQPDRRLETETMHSALSMALTKAYQARSSPISQDLPRQNNLLKFSSLTSEGSLPSHSDLFSCFQWDDEPLSAYISRLDSGLLFDCNKTYWLVGLSAGLGPSICDWMLAHGARYVVLSSRNPRVDEIWLQGHERNGIVIKIFRCDVTAQDAVQDTYSRIATDEQLPPLAGVINGAMVLKDNPIRNMSTSDLNDVLQPKVNGSINLDRVLADSKLDFFIFLSSMVNVLGNVGQANYCAANAFMSALASQRRQRGLAAQVVNIGAVSGAGYITRELGDAGVHRQLMMLGLKMISEGDLHQLLAEAIADRPKDWNGGYDTDIGFALQQSDSSDITPLWHDNPKFQRFLPKSTIQDTSDMSSGTALSGKSVRDRLAISRSREDIWSIAKETLLSKIQSSLQIEDCDDACMTMRSNQLGIDSLVAVDLRTWLLNNFQVNISVLEILSGITIGDIVDRVSISVPPELVPNVNPKPHSSESEAGFAPGTSPVEAQTSVVPKTDEDSALPMVHSSPSVQKTSPLSSSQSMFWVVQNLVEDKTTLNHTVLFSLEGALIRKNDLNVAVSALGQRHEALRTSFSERDGQPLQHVLKSSTLKMEEGRVLDEYDAKQEFERAKSHIFDLASGDVMRFILLTTPSPQRSYIIISAHHIVMDGLCLQVFLQDIEETYNTGRAVRDSGSSLVRQFAEFVTSQREALQNGLWDVDLAYWRGVFGSSPAPLPLTRARVSSRKPLTEYAVHRCDINIDKTLANKIRAIGRVYGTTPFHFYLTTFRVLLYRFLYSGRDENTDSGSLLADSDICIGIADGNRKDDNILRSVGPYMNLLPIRFGPTRAPTDATPLSTFAQELKNACDKTLEALRHSAPSFEAILDYLRIDRAVEYAPLFQAFLNYRQGWNHGQVFLNCSAEMLEFEPGRVPYDLSLDIIDNSGSNQGTMISFMGQTALYSMEDVATFARCYTEFLEEFSNYPEEHIDQPDWSFPKAETEPALQLGTGPRQDMTWSLTLMHRVKSIVSQFGDHQAIVTVGDHSRGSSLTYKQLWSKVSQIANQLLSLGVTPGNHVGVLQHPSRESVGSMLAIMAIGAVYVPLDCNHHTARLRTMLLDFGPSVLLVGSSSRTKASEIVTSSNLHAMHIINVSELVTDESVESMDLELHASPTAPAVILYTSGTTGTPKGVVVPHSSLCHEIELNSHIYGVDSDVVVLQQSACGFDMAVQQVFVALAYGGTACVISNELHGDSSAIAEAMVNYKVTFTCATPTEYSSWIRYGAYKALQQCQWRVAISGGESATEELLSAFRHLGKSDLKLFNCYGPTETTCCSTRLQLDYQTEGVYQEYSMIPVGPASSNEVVYIVDDNMRLLPTGLPGEIVISGLGVTAGYLNDGAKTKQSFIPDKFFQQVSGTEERPLMYRTRDRGRLLKNGWISIEGRVDQDTMIKLRGVRVDLQDIEQTIMKTAPKDTISHAIASLRSDEESSKYIVAHVVFASRDLNDSAERTSFLSLLRENLPLSRPMLPSVVLPLDKLPLTSSGKLDRRFVQQLPIDMLSQTPGNGQDSDQRPQSTLETKLKLIWTQVLSRREVRDIDPMTITASTNFFHIGGTSLLLLEVQSKIQKDLGIPVQLYKLFESSTLLDMTQLIALQGEALVPSNTPSDEIAIDWEREASLPRELQDEIIRTNLDQEQSLSQSTNYPPRVVLLTGAAGSLGQRILHLLLENPAVEQVFCVALRRVDERISSGTLPRSETGRVTYYEGDLRLPRLGLSVEDFALLSKTLDVIIHVGADVSHAKTYHTLKEANVGSVGELLKMSLPRTATIHFVSSGEVAMLGASSIHSHGSESDLQDCRIFSEESVVTNGIFPQARDAAHEGYAASKWVAERMLENAFSSGAKGRAWIHRPSSIIPPSKENVSDSDVYAQEIATFYQGASAPLLQSFLYYSRKLGLIPTKDRLLRGSLNLVDMDTVARNIMNTIFLEPFNDANMRSSLSNQQVMHRNHIGQQNHAVEDMEDLLLMSKTLTPIIKATEFRATTLADWDRFPFSLVPLLDAGSHRLIKMAQESDFMTEVFTELAIALLAIVFRVYAPGRSQGFRNLQSDDYFMMFAGYPKWRQPTMSIISKESPSKLRLGKKKSGPYSVRDITQHDENYSTQWINSIQSHLSTTTDDNEISDRLDSTQIDQMKTCSAEIDGALGPPTSKLWTSAEGDDLAHQQQQQDDQGSIGVITCIQINGAETLNEFERGQVGFYW
ncbi:hypothetical protein EJ05DRAFT_500564 [Pseudovirgaria hyperparasitica]|uniref:Polyketide synthase n=1 Tax=Pseudovirgaria hyperparasitica TaxID=470096 RepID=A0A6A6W832_9PEZI|nr:uncharacterized protein EJ05DRAFT_500564 [Pseudovirgaria hyperparasitica]KAF2758046.1 hypothetical protein EJ05DRAFT_500564 [Pseudovirgaria hyperparasitica]